MKIYGFWRVVFISMLFAVLSASAVSAKPIGQDEAEKVARAWVGYVVKHDGHWGDRKEASAAGIEPFIFEGDVVGYVLNVKPAGFVLVPADDELPPVKVYSTDSVFQPGSNYFTEWIGRELHDLIASIKEKPLFSPVNEGLWKRLKEEKGRESSPCVSAIPAPVLTTTLWNQGDPYNRFCPVWNEEHCVVGCLATAYAQIIRFWAWPPNGKGSHSYISHTHRFRLAVDYEHPYDWENMPNSMTFATEQQKDEVARLSYEVGVAVNMDYDPEGSGPFTRDFTSFLPEHFSYNNDIKEESYPGNDESWFNSFKEEIDLGRPVFFIIMAPDVGHAVVVDGYRTDQGNLLHINMGWGGWYTAYYATNNILDFSDLWGQGIIKNIHPAETRPVEALSDAEPAGGVAPVTINFAGQGKRGAGPFDYHWDFGDGSTAEGQNQSHIFRDAGTYTAVLTVTDSVSQTAEDSHLTIHVIEGTGLVAAAQASSMSGKIPLTVDFTAAVKGGTPPYSYVWDFGDGSIETTSVPAASHTFTRTGDFFVLLRIIDAAQVQTNASEIEILAKPSGPVPSINGVIKMTSPFRLKILGSNFVQGSKIRIDGAEVPGTVFRKSTKLVAEKGALLKSMCPKDTEVTVTVENEEGNISNEFYYSR